MTQQPQTSTGQQQRQRRARAANSQDSSHFSRNVSTQGQMQINTNRRKYNSERVSNPSSRTSPSLDISETHAFADNEISHAANLPPNINSSHTIVHTTAENSNRIHNNSYELSDSSSIESPPPLDEYVDTEEEVPPYRENLHKYLDIFSFDPRFAPVLRVNKALVPNNDILDVSIQHFTEFNLLPPDIDLWKIHHIDDLEFNDILPTIISSIPAQNSQQELVEDLRRIEEMERNQSIQERQIQSTTTEIDDSDIQLACILSLIDISQDRRRHYSGFRYHSPTVSHT